MKKKQAEKTPKEMTLKNAVIGFLLPMIVMIPLIIWGVSLTLAIFMAVLTACAYGYVMKFSWTDLEDAMSEGIKSIASASMIMILVGALIGVWMASGSIPAMLYYGLKIINPTFFLPVAFLLSAFVAIVTGTSWGAIGTIGVALIGMSGGLGIPLYFTAGAIISGAQMGDKMSPLSDTTLLASASAEVSVFQHIVSMFYTTVPAAVICLVLYGIIGFQYSGSMDYSQVNVLTDGITSAFRINLLVLVPVVLVLLLSMKQVPAFVTFSIGLIISGIWAWLFQGVQIADSFGYAMNGYVAETGIESLDGLLSRGGISGMLELVSVVLMAGMLSGLLEKMKVLNTIVDALTRKVRSVGGIISATLASSFLLAIITGSQYPPLTIPAVAFKDTFDRLDIHRAVLSRTMEDMGTLLCAILPWGIATAFYSATLGVEPLAYIPFTFLPFLSPIFAIINAWTGIGVFRKADTVKYRPFWRRDKHK